jgi:hypothetical protein
MQPVIVEAKAAVARAKAESRMGAQHVSNGPTYRRRFKSSSEETGLKIQRKLELEPRAPVDPAAIERLLAIPELLL